MYQVNSTRVLMRGSTVLTLKDIDRIQPNNIAELVDKLPEFHHRVPRPGGQTLNIWGWQS